MRVRIAIPPMTPRWAAEIVPSAATLAALLFFAGTALGLTIIATGRQDVPDLAYHASILAALAVTLIALLRPRSTR